MKSQNMGILANRFARSLAFRGATTETSSQDEFACMTTVVCVKWLLAHTRAARRGGGSTPIEAQLQRLALGCALRHRHLAHGAVHGGDGCAAAESVPFAPSAATATAAPPR